MKHMAGPYCAECGGWHPSTTGGCPFDTLRVVDFTTQPVATVDMSPTVEELVRLRAELAAARERADTLHAALDEAVDLLHGLEEPAWSGIGGSATVDRLSDLVDRLAAPTSAAHTGEGGEHGGLR